MAYPEESAERKFQYGDKVKFVKDGATGVIDTCYGHHQPWHYCVKLDVTQSGYIYNLKNARVNELELLPQ